ncbi:hypothetical protein PQY70_00480 [Flavobacteriaceae bacterium]|nr:hypothetical protein [Flavobacteriaceae bacterium]
MGNETREETKGEGVIGLQILLHKKPPKRKKGSQSRMKNYNWKK